MTCTGALPSFGSCSRSTSRVSPRELEDKVRAAFPDAQSIEARDLTGTGDHFALRVVSGAFAGKTRIEQHKMIYAALGEAMNGPIHALTMDLEVPRG